MSKQMLRMESLGEGELWNALISTLPYTHILQTWEWGQVKSAYGWKPMYQVWRDSDGKPVAAALTLERTINIMGSILPLRVIYVPKGPLLTNWEEAGLCQQVLADMIDLARRRKAIFIKVDPDIPLGYGIPGSTEDRASHLGRSLLNKLKSTGWKFSTDQIQFRNTVIIGLEPSEDDLLASMKQKTRYNIRLAMRKGVQVRTAVRDDLEMLYHMYAETAVRDGFIIRERDYYLKLWAAFLEAGLATPLIAEVEGEEVAALLVFRFGAKAWYLFGMSREKHREKMPNYLLQWEAIKRMKAVRCREYDLWGAPDSFTEQDNLWGVYRFKEGLGGEVVRNLGAWDYPVRPQLYSLYVKILPRILAVVRKRGAARIRHSVDQ